MCETREGQHVVEAGRSAVLDFIKEKMNLVKSANYRSQAR